MKRFLSIVAAIAAITAGVLVFNASPASAHSGVCVGQGTATTGAGIMYPGVSLTGTTTGANLNFNLGGCVTTPGVVTLAPIPNIAQVTVTGFATGGFCGHSIGINGTTVGHSFGYTSVGSLLLVHNIVNQKAVPPTIALGETAVGIVNAIPDALNGESCAAAPGADAFIVTGVVVLVGP